MVPRGDRRIPWDNLAPPLIEIHRRQIVPQLRSRFFTFQFWAPLQGILREGVFNYQLRESFL